MKTIANTLATAALAIVFGGTTVILTTTPAYAAEPKTAKEIKSGAGTMNMNGPFQSAKDKKAGTPTTKKKGIVGKKKKSIVGDGPRGLLGGDIGIPQKK